MAAFDPTKPFKVVPADFDPSKGFKKVSPGALPEVSGALSTLWRSIPFVDEANDGAAALVDTAVDLATGKAKISPRELVGNPLTAPYRTKAFQENWNERRKSSRALADDFKDRRPLAAATMEGVGLAAQVVPALLTGGSSAAPTVAAKTAPRGLMGASARIAKPIADAAVSAGLGAQVTGLGGEGTLEERVADANRATLPAMAIGAAVPAGIMAAGAARRGLSKAAQASGRTAARAANRAAGGQILDPQLEAAKRLGEALKADGLGPEDVRAALVEWQRSGASSPALMDLAGENTRALLRSAASKPGAGRNLAVQYADEVAADLQDNAIGRTRAMVRDNRTLPAVEGEIARRIEDVSAIAPDVPPGSGGAAISDALNARRDAAMGGVNAAYAQAREAGRGVRLPAEEVPQLAGRLRESVADFVPDSISNTRRALSMLDDLGGTTELRDIFATRAMLSNLRSQAGPEAAAAGRAVREIDTFVDDAMQRGLFAGDDEAVNLWRSAIGQRREFGQAFEGDDLIARLTARERHGEGLARAVAPEDASAAILGRSGVSPRPNLVRDLTRMRDTLGEGPEWAQFQSEAVSRLLGRDAGEEGFGDAWLAFERQNPELARLLMPGEQRRALDAGRQQIADAVADRGALGAGRGVLRTAPDRLAEEVSGIGERRPLAQLGAAREIEDQIGRPAEGSTGLLNRLSSGTNPRRNLSAIFGEDEAGRYQDAIRREIGRMGNARFVSPNTNSQTAIRQADDALVEMPPVTKWGILKAIVDKVRRGATLTDAEREALLRLGTTRINAADDVPSIPLVDGTRRLLTGPQRARVARTISQFEGARQGGERSRAVAP